METLNLNWDKVDEDVFSGLLECYKPVRNILFFLSFTECAALRLLTEVILSIGLAPWAVHVMSLNRSYC